MVSKIEFVNKFMKLEKVKGTDVPEDKKGHKLVHEPTMVVDCENNIIVPKDRTSFYELYDLYEKAGVLEYKIYQTRCGEFWVVERG